MSVVLLKSRPTGRSVIISVSVLGTMCSGTIMRGYQVITGRKGQLIIPTFIFRNFTYTLREKKKHN